MSQYFSFYLAKKDAEGKYNFLAPYIKKDGEFKPRSLLTRSRSFIDREEFEDMSVAKIDLANMDETLASLCRAQGWNSEEYYSTGWAIPIKNIRGAGFSGGIYRGYVSPEDFTYLKNQDFNTESRYDVDLISADLVAEQGKGDRVSVAFTAYNDTAYYCDLIAREVDELTSWDILNENEELFVIFETGY